MEQKPEFRRKIKSNDRVTIMGKTGSGKSYMMKSLIERLKRVVFIDPKCEHVFTNKKNYYLFTSFKEAAANYRKIHSKQEFFIHIKPKFITREELDVFLSLVYDLYNVTLVFDEVGHFCFPRVSIFHDLLIRQGRSKGIGVWHITQRPKFIDGVILSECEHVFVFQLKTKADRDKACGCITDIPEEEMKERLMQKYHFYYDNSEHGCVFCNPI
jgi:ABC-type dipeptide/oligopeptide/nickel transport system ATPase component